MRLDEKAITRGCGAEVRTGEQLCMAQLDRFLAALATGRPLTVACTAQAPLFAQEAEAAQAPVPTFVNVREHAGWSAEGRNAEENLCDNARFTGYQIDGGYASHTVADARYCFHLPEDYGDAEAAPLLCEGLIGYR